MFKETLKPEASPSRVNSLFRVNLSLRQKCASHPDWLPTAAELKRSRTAMDGGYAVFNYDAASDTFTPATAGDRPPQGNDAKGGVACHNLAASRDYTYAT